MFVREITKWEQKPDKSGHIYCKNFFLVFWYGLEYKFKKNQNLFKMFLKSKFILISQSQKNVSLNFP